MQHTTPDKPQKATNHTIESSSHGNDACSNRQTATSNQKPLATLCCVRRSLSLEMPPNPIMAMRVNVTA
jgi:hypothetical protein